MYMLDESEFLSEHGIRALSRVHRDKPFTLSANGASYQVDYQPAESSSGLFGGNSNWRGPVWFPVNFLLIESLQKFHHFLVNDVRAEFPTGSVKRKLCGKFPLSFPGDWCVSFCAMAKAADRFLDQKRNFKLIRNGAITFLSTSTFMVILAPELGQATKRAGQGWWRN
jgi:hypothetical protein